MSLFLKGYKKEQMNIFDLTEALIDSEYDHKTSEAFNKTKLFFSL